MITGTVVDDVSDEPLSFVSLHVHDDNGDIIASVATNLDGEFRVGGFPAGSYYLRTAVGETPARQISLFEEENTYFDRVHGLLGSCSGHRCDVLAGTPLILDGIADPAPLQFRLESGPVIRGQIVSADSGLPVGWGGHVDLFDDQDGFVGRYKNSFQGFQSVALADGTYTLVPFVNNAFTAVADAPDQPEGAPRQASGGGPSGISVTIEGETVEVSAPVASDFIFASRFEAAAE